MKFIKKLKECAEKFVPQLIFFVLCMLGVLALGGAFSDMSHIGDRLRDYFIGSDTMAVFIAALVSLILTRIVHKLRDVIEDSLKIEDDHHKIICHYYGHDKDPVDENENFFQSDGRFMYLDTLVENKGEIKNDIDDKYTKQYINKESEIQSYVNGKLLLPSLNIFANIEGNVKAKFDDSDKKFELPDFITDNALALMDAHSSSKVVNTTTVRLSDVQYDKKGNLLTLTTQRSQYFDMLITNRCMDFEMPHSLSLRDVYESGDKISPLAQSKFGNQIGINGLIFSKDGCLLLEKRGRKKTTWKNKFAQPISLAMKWADVNIEGANVINDKPETCNKVFEDIVLKTIKKNFGLVPDDIFKFDFSVNFLGVARDLLEGGKPNLYFYVITKKTAVELKSYLEDNAEFAANALSNESLNIYFEQKARVAEKQGNAENAKKYFALADTYKNEEKPLNRSKIYPQLTNDKLENDYYLVPYDRLKFDYNYVLELSYKSSNIEKVNRKFAPQVAPNTQRRSVAKFKRQKRRDCKLKRECGEALLVCLCFANICHKRLRKEFEDIKNGVKVL